MSKLNLETIEINGVEYVKKSELMSNKAETLNGMPYCIVRTYSAGVFSGYVESRNGKEAVIRNVRCLWYWDGAASLLQLAKSGVKNPQNCKFTCTVDKIELTEVIEIIECTEEAKKNIMEVSEWIIK